MKRLLLVCLLFPVMVFAQEIPMALSAWLELVIKAVGSFQGASAHVIVASVIAVLIAALRVSPFQPIWDKLGRFKPVLAPLLALIGSVVSFVVLKDFSLNGILAALLNGGIALAIADISIALGAKEIGDIIKNIVKAIKPK